MTEKKKRRKSCFRVGFNLFPECKTCKDLLECGKAWIRAESEALFNKGD